MHKNEIGTTYVNYVLVGTFNIQSKHKSTPLTFVYISPMRADFA